MPWACAMEVHVHCYSELLLFKEEDSNVKTPQVKPVASSLESY